MPLDLDGHGVADNVVVGLSGGVLRSPLLHSAPLQKAVEVVLPPPGGRPAVDGAAVRPLNSSASRARDRRSRPALWAPLCFCRMEGRSLHWGTNS